MCLGLRYFITFSKSGIAVEFLFWAECKIRKHFPSGVWYQLVMLSLPGVLKLNFSRSVWFRPKFSWFCRVRLVTVVFDECDDLDDDVVCCFIFIESVPWNSLGRGVGPKSCLSRLTFLSVLILNLSQLCNPSVLLVLRWVIKSVKSDLNSWKPSSGLDKD